jgi:hypothetical protein
MTELIFYPMFSYGQLVRMGDVYYSGKATTYQSGRYEAIRSGLLTELRLFDPKAPDSGTAAYIHAAIRASIEYANRQEKINNDRARANMQTAHNQLKNWR